MIQYVKEGGAFGRAFIEQLKERSANSGKKVDDAVAEIIATVRRDGDAAVQKAVDAILYHNQVAFSCNTSNHLTAPSGHGMCRRIIC